MVIRSTITNGIEITKKSCENCQYALVYNSGKLRCYHDHTAKIDQYTLCEKHVAKETVNVKRIPLDSDKNTGVMFHRNIPYYSQTIPR